MISQRFARRLALAALALAAAPALRAQAPATAQIPAPTIAPDAQASPQAQALEADFLAVWPVLLRGDFKAGVPATEALLQRCREQLGAGAATTLKVQYFLAVALHRMGRPAQAKTLFEDALLQHAAAGSQDSRSALSSRAGLARAVEDLDGPRSALPLYEDAMARRSRTLGDDDLESVTLLDDYAGVLVEAGQVHTALPLMDRALQLRTEGLGPTHRWTLTTLNNRANAFMRLGRHAQALADSETVLRLRMQTLGERDPTTLVAMNLTGTALTGAGRAEEGLLLHERAVALKAEVMGAQHPSTLGSRRARADDLLALGRVGEARTALQSLAQQSTAVLGPTHRGTFSARMLLARSLELLGEHDAALAELDALLALHVQALGAEHFDTLSVGVQRARVLRLLGRAGEGRSALQALLPVVAERYGARSWLHTQAAAELAACTLQAGAPQPAAEALSALLAEASGAEGSDAPARQAERRTWQRWRVRALAEQGDVQAAFAALDGTKSSQLLQSLGERAAAESAGVARTEVAQLQDLRERIAVLQDALRTARSPQDRQDTLAQIDTAVQAAQALQASLRQRHPQYARLTQVPVATRRTAADLPAGALLVSYVVEDGSRVGAFTLGKDGHARWHALGTQPGLGQSVASLRLWATQLGRPRLADDTGRAVEIVHWHNGAHPRWRVVALDAPACTNPEDAPGCKPASARSVAGAADYDTLRQHLAALLLEPLRDALQSHTQWVLSPDDGLGAVPWDLLPWQRGLVAEHAQVVLLPSLAALSALDETRSLRRKASKGTADSLDLLAIGSPLFTDTAATPDMAEAPLPGRGPWAPLPAADQEMRGAAAQFPRQRTLVASGAQATEAQLRALSAQGTLARARYLLVATHAWYEPSRPGRSHLVFGATGPGVAQDGRISATELAGLDLRSDLTVVSACSTALGDASAVDGHFGFAYALMLAGNRQALLTLWPVGDVSSAAFVTRFFQHLARLPRTAGGPALALQATKRDFLQHPRKDWRHPRVWAAFVLIGA